MKSSLFPERLLAISAALTAVVPVTLRAQEQRGPQNVVLEEITVTATRTSEKLSRVAASVTAFDQAKLDEEGVRSMDDVARLTPGVVFTNTGFAGNTQISIRGIASTVGASTTGVYLDDTPVQVRALGFASANPYPEVFDLARVEILRGPQGTLFGAGSEGGTVRFISPQPSLTDYTGYSRAEAGFTEHGSPSWEGGTAVGGPLIEDKLGFRASAWGRHSGGFIDSVSRFDGGMRDKDANWRNAYSARLALAYVPVDWLTITPSVYYQKTHDNGSAEFLERISDPNDGEFRTAEPLGSSVRDKYVLPTLNIQANLGGYTLTSVTSQFMREGDPYQDYSLSLPGLLVGFDAYQNTLYIPGLPQYTLGSRFATEQDNFTQEIRLQTADANARWTGIVGFFLQRARQETKQIFDDPLLPDLVATYLGIPIEFLGSPMLSPTRSYYAEDVSHDDQEAIFGEVSYRVTERLKATVGVRYARTKFKYKSFQAGPWAGTTGLAVRGSQKEEPVTPKFGLTYEFDDYNMVYATAAKGFRSGGSNKPIPVTNPACQGDLDALGLTASLGPYDADSVWSYEIGAKNNGLFNGRLQLYSSAYYIKWSDIQQSIPLSNCGFNYVGNLGSAVSKGADVQFQTQIGDGFTFSGSIAYNDAYYDKTVFGSPIGTNGERAIVVDDGDGLPSAPWMVSLTSEYEHPMFGNEGYARVTYTHRARNDRKIPERDSDTVSYNPDAFEGKDVNLINTRVGMRFSNFDVSLFVNNLLDKQTILSRNNYATGALVFFDTTVLPRTIGLTGTFQF